MNRLTQASGAAVSTLLKTMLDPNTLAATPVRAAESVLTQAAQGIGIEDVNARLADQENTLRSENPDGMQ
jgi:hypothetical protein